MRGRPALIGSVIAHGVMLACVARCAVDRGRSGHAASGRSDEDAAAQRATSAVMVPIELVRVAPAHARAVEAVPLEVVVLSEESLESDPASVAVGGGGRASGAPRAASIETGRSRGTGEVAGPGRDAPDARDGAGGRNALGMRGLRHDLSISGDTLERILRESKPLAPPVASTGRLAAAGAEHVIHDKVATIRVHPDGTVDMKAKPDFDIKLAIPITSFQELRRGLGELLTEWYRDPYALVGAGTVELPKETYMLPSPCDVHGDTQCGPIFLPGGDGGGGGRGGGDDDGGVGFALIKGKADITSYLMRKLKVGDAYSSRKLKLLDSTRAERVQIGAAHRAEQLDRSAELVHRNLEALWQTTPDPVARREALFALWDECAEGEGSAGEAGERARSMVIGWIRTHLPAGGPGAFTAAEIARLDAARSSKQHFAPYP